MNTDRLTRTTFVLPRETSDRLSYIARRLAVSRSALVRDVLEEPVALMAKWCETLPEHPSPAEAASTLRLIETDVVEMIGRRSAQVELALGEVDGNA